MHSLRERKTLSGAYAEEVGKQKRMQIMDYSEMNQERRNMSNKDLEDYGEEAVINDDDEEDFRGAGKDLQFLDNLGVGEYCEDGEEPDDEDEFSRDDNIVLEEDDANEDDAELISGGTSSKSDKKK